LYCPLAAKGGVYSRWWERASATRFLFNRLDKVIAVTENVYHSIATAGVSRNKLQLLPMSVDTQRFSTKVCKGENKYFPKGCGNTKILFIGNTSKEKGLIELLDAIKILIRKGFLVNLVATIENQSNIQEYSDREEYAKEHIRELDLRRHVRLLGLVEAIEDLYAEADIIIIPWNTSRGPSDYPMVALEAMAMGKCIVSTPVGGCPKLLRDGKVGILTEGFSARPIAAAIEHAITHPKICTQLGQGALKASNGFSMETVGRQMVNLYESLLKSKVCINEK
jgi:glycosyltransferase involved in cell wall biosynthesis